MRYLGVMACLAVASAFFACGGDGNGGGGGPGVEAGAGGESDTPAGGASNTGATSSMGGDPGPGPGPDPSAGTGTGAGAGGEPPLGPASMGTPRNGVGQVVDGVVARSENFTMILSVGEEPGGNVSMNSSEYRINLGVVGSTQK